MVNHMTGTWYLLSLFLLAFERLFSNALTWEFRVVFHWGPGGKEDSEFQGHRTMRMFCILSSGPYNREAEPGRWAENMGLGNLPCSDELCLHTGSQITDRTHLNRVHCLPLGWKTEEAGQWVRHPLVSKGIFLRVSEKYKQNQEFKGRWRGKGR